MCEILLASKALEISAATLTHWSTSMISNPHGVACGGLLYSHHAMRLSFGSLRCCAFLSIVSAAGKALPLSDFWTLHLSKAQRAVRGQSLVT